MVRGPLNILQKKAIYVILTSEVSNLTSISVRMDDSLKQSFESACDAMGMSMATCLTIFAKRVARDRRIPFDVSAPPDLFYSERNLRAIEDADERVKSGRYVVKTLEELEEMAHA